MPSRVSIGCDELEGVAFGGRPEVFWAGVEALDGCEVETDGVISKPLANRPRLPRKLLLSVSLAGIEVMVSSDLDCFRMLEDEDFLLIAELTECEDPVLERMDTVKDGLRLCPSTGVIRRPRKGSDMLRSRGVAAGVG